MSRLTSGNHGALSRLTGGEWAGRHSLSRREEPFGASRGLVVAGVVAVGIGLLAWYYIGPDVKRYMKLRNM
jgi:hypothetical protein